MFLHLNWNIAQLLVPLLEIVLPLLRNNGHYLYIGYQNVRTLFATWTGSIHYWQWSNFWFLHLALLFKCSARYETIVFALRTRVYKAFIVPKSGHQWMCETSHTCYTREDTYFVKSFLVVAFVFVGFLWPSMAWRKFVQNHCTQQHVFIAFKNPLNYVRASLSAFVMKNFCICPLQLCTTLLGYWICK